MEAVDDARLWFWFWFWCGLRSGDICAGGSRDGVPVSTSCFTLREGERCTPTAVVGLGLHGVAAACEAAPLTLGWAERDGCAVEVAAATLGAAAGDVPVPAMGAPPRVGVV